VSFSLEEVLKRVRRIKKPSAGGLSGSNYKTTRHDSTYPTHLLRTLELCSTASLLAAYQLRAPPCLLLGEAWPSRNRQESGYGQCW